MIEKPTTSEVMEIFKNSISQIDGLKEEIFNAKDAIEKRLALLNAQMEYSITNLLSVKELGGPAQNKIVFMAEEKYGNYDSFGITIHPKLVKTPYNVLNFRTTTGYIYKNNATVTVNDELNTVLVEALKHDSVDGKSFEIQEFDTDSIEIAISIDPKNTLGALTFNMLEIQPYLPGSFHIEYINVFERGNTDTPVQSIHNIEHVGAGRLVFTEKTAVIKLVLKIRLLYKNANGKYPFGLKHLYLLNADFQEAITPSLSESPSYVIVRLDYNTEISYIFDDIVVKDQFGVDTEAKCSDLGIQFYAAYDGDSLSREIEVSTVSEPSYLATNIKSCFVRVPITTSMMAITPHIETGAQFED